jgi:hypothetical protein
MPGLLGLLATALDTAAHVAGDVLGEQRARSRAASTAFVVGRSTAAGIVRVATSIITVSSTRSISPLSSTTRTSIGAESICTHSPGRGDGPEPAVRRLGQGPPGAG